MLPISHTITQITRGMAKVNKNSLLPPPLHGQQQAGPTLPGFWELEGAGIEEKASEDSEKSCG